MKWISTKDAIPEEGKYVLARHNRGTWHDSTDQENVNCVVVKLVKGLSKKDRSLMESGDMESPEIEMIGPFGTETVPVYKLFGKHDEDGNNLVPYGWDSFGNLFFFGQEITHWTPITLP